MSCLAFFMYLHADTEVIKVSVQKKKPGSITGNEKPGEGRPGRSL